MLAYYAKWFSKSWLHFFGDEIEIFDLKITSLSENKSRTNWQSTRKDSQTSWDTDRVITLKFDGHQLPTTFIDANIKKKEVL